MRKKALKFRHCKGCKWEHNYDECPNDYKSKMLKHSDGTLQCGYCRWNNKMTPKITHKIKLIEEKLK